MNFFLTTVGSAGDVFPMLGLAAKLQAHGHQVKLCTNAYFAPHAARNGLAFEPLGSVEEYYACIQNPDLWHPQKAFKHVFTYFKTILKRQHELLVSESRTGPVIGISSCLGFGARMAVETHQIPVLTVHLQPAVIWSDIAPPTISGLHGPRWLKRMFFRLGEKLAVDRVVGAFLNPWRAEYGLPPMKKTTRWWNSPTGILCLFPEWFAQPQTDWPQPLLQTDFPLWNDGADQPLSTELEQFLSAGDPPLVFTPGTANIHGQQFFHVGMQVCRSLKRRGLFLTRHPEQLPNPLPESIKHVDYVPLDLLLPRCGAFIHHGGIGSTSQGMLAGVPQVTMPLAHDQFDNAARIESLHIGRGLPIKKFTVPRLTETLQHLLGSSDVGRACRDVQQRLSPRTGLDQTVLAIEKHFKLQ